MNAEHLVAWLPFDESTTQDLCGNTWTAQGSPTISNGELQLNGSSYLQMNGGITLGGQDFTIAHWLTVDGTSENLGAVWCIYQGSTRFLSLFINSSKHPVLRVKEQLTDIAIPTATKSHIEINYSSGQVKVFVNGTLTATITQSLTRTELSFVALGNGTWTGADAFAGSIDEFMIYDGVALHTENFTPPTAADYLQLRLAMGLPVPFEFDADAVAIIQNALLTWRYENAGKAELLVTSGTTLEVDENKSLSGFAFYGSTASYDNLNTPVGLKEVWFKFDLYLDSALAQGDRFSFGHYSSTLGGYVGCWNGGGALTSWDSPHKFLVDAHPKAALDTKITGTRGALNRVLLHMKSDATDGLIELTVNGSTYTFTGNVNNGADFDSLYFFSNSPNCLFSNIIVSNEAIAPDEGWQLIYFDTARQVVNALGQAQAVQFDGAGAYGIFPATVVQSLSAVTSYTFEITFSTEDTRTGSDGVNCYALISYNDNSLLARNAFTLAMENGSPWVRTTYTTVFFQPSIKLNGGQVHQLALVKDETRLSLYVDDGLIASNTGYDINFVDLSRSFYLGTTKFLTRFLQMDLYGLRIWSRALSAEELFAPLDGSEQGLLADYLPELRDDNILPDISGNENHLALYGAVALQWSFVLDADTECTVIKSFGYEGIDAVTTSELIRVEDKTFNLTGSAFYSADLLLPSMPEVWIEFSVYNRDLDGWQVGNDHDNFTGIAGIAPDTSTTSTPLNFAAYNLNAVISSDPSGLTKSVQTFLMHMLADDADGLIEVWLDGVPHYTYRGSVNGGEPFDKMFLHSSGATCFQSFRISNTEFPSKQIIVLDFDVEALVVNEAFAWSVDETHVERYWAPPGGTYPPWFVDVVVHDRTAWYQTVVTKAFDLPPTYHLWIDFDVYFDGVHSWRAGNIGEPGLCGVTSGNPLSGFSNGEQVYPTTNLLQATGAYEWMPVLVHLQSGTTGGVVEAWFNGDKVFEYEGNVNDGEPFADPVLQSDGAGTYFSYLLFSTNPLEPRRNVDVIYLCVLRGGQVLTFPLYAYETCAALALAVRYDGRNWYNILRDPSDERTSDFYIIHAESIYALTKG